MDEFDEWAKGEEQKERKTVAEIKQSLENFGAAPDMEQPLTELAKSLDNQVKGKSGIVYVAIPSTEKVLPLLRKVVGKVLGAFMHIHDMTKKTQEHVENARVSLRAKLPQKKIEADQMNEARRAAERHMRQEQQVSVRKKNEPLL